jgi:hypothetical protein
MDKMYNSQTPQIPSSTTTPIASANLEGKSEDVKRKIKQNLDELSKEMIQKTGDYIKDEIDYCIADYQVLEQINKSVMEKYKTLTSHSKNINQEMSKLNEAYANLLPYLSQINNVEKMIGELEISSHKLEQYSKRLESKYKHFAERLATNK